MLFRPATPQELHAVMSIIEDGRAALAALGIDQWQGGWPNEQIIREDIENGITYVAVLEQNDLICDGKATERPASAHPASAALTPKRIVGTLAFCDQGDPDYDRVIAGAWLTQSPNTPQPNHPVQYAAIHRLAVAACATRQGVASFMLRSACTLAQERGLVSVRVDTHAGNDPMKHILEACGLIRCCEVNLATTIEPTKNRIGYEILL